MESTVDTAKAKTESRPFMTVAAALLERWQVLVAALMLCAAVVAAAWFVNRERTVQFDPAGFQAVLLSNGQVYYGKLEGYGSAHPVLREVYYVQTTMNEQTREQSNTLLRRGKEWHGPDRMWLNANQILLVEPVGKDSKVASLIRESQYQK